MRSLYVGVLTAMLAIVSLSLLAFVAISDHVESTELNPVLEAMDELELESAISALNSGGAAAVSTYMQRLNQSFGTSHYLLDANGIDVVSGHRLEGVLPLAPLSKSRGDVEGQFVVTHRSADGRYWFVSFGPRQPGRWIFFPYYLLVIGVIGGTCWLVTLGIVSPIRRMTAAVERFGKGDHSARADTKRKDEIGGLARSFNRMASHIERLLANERRLLEDISHELRAPLSRLTFAVLLARTAPDSKMALDRVERDVNRITALVSEIVEMTRLEGDPTYFKMETVKIQEVIEETVSDSQLEARFQGCNIRLVGQLPCEVSGDRELLRRAIENVLRNAIRYSPEQSTVDVTLGQTGSVATITIRDYGPGVPEQSLVEIFEPFFRVEEARETGLGGIGLGLSIAKRAVQLHHGTIVAENAFPGLQVHIKIPFIVSQRQRG